MLKAKSPIKRHEFVLRPRKVFSLMGKVADEKEVARKIFIKEMHSLKAVGEKSAENWRKLIFLPG